MADDNNQSDDDALKPDNGIFDPLKDEDKLDEDGASPAAPASDIHSSAPIDEPATDDGMDSDEVYQEGVRGATGADDEEVELDDDNDAIKRIG